MVTADKDVLTGQLEELTERLKDARDSYGQLEEGYRQEIRSKTKLADLHAEQASNAKEEILELQRAVEELQRIARESADRLVVYIHAFWYRRDRDIRDSTQPYVVKSYL